MVGKAHGVVQVVQHRDNAFSILGLPLGATLVAFLGLAIWQAIIVAILFLPETKGQELA